MRNKFPLLAALFLILGGTTVLFGWVFDIPEFKSISPNWVSMKPNVALCFILIGVSLLFSVTSSTRLSRFGQGISPFVFIIAVLTLIQYLFDCDIGIDQLLFQDEQNAVRTSHLGRMAPESTICFSLLAIAMWELNSRTKCNGVLLGVIGFVVLVFSLSGIAMYLDLSANLLGFSTMALHTATLFSIAGFAVIKIGLSCIFEQRLHKNHVSLLNSSVVAISLITIVVFMVWVLQSRDFIENRTALLTQNLATTTELALEGLFDKAAIAIQSVADGISEEKKHHGSSEAKAIIEQSIEKQKDRLPEFDYFYGVNENGDILYSSDDIKNLSYRINVADHEHFQQLRDSKNPNLIIITSPVVSSTTNEWILLIICRVNKSDGSFDGVVSAAIKLEKLNAFLANVQLNADDSVALRSANLELIARYPSPEKVNLAINSTQIALPFVNALKKNPTSGTYISGKTSIDNISRTHSYRQNVKYGFIINVGVSRKNTLKEWNKQVWIISCLVIIFIALLLFFLRMIKKAWLGQEQDIKKLKIAKIEIDHLNANLEKRVQQRTAELEMSNQSLLFAKNAAEKANIAKSTFIATMSHELRTPLNAILGFSELMSLDETTTTKQKETLNIINSSGAHLLAMINNVLDISKIEAGRLELDNQIFDLVQLLDDIGRMISIRAVNKKLDFHTEISPNIAPVISADRGKLRQILINLLGNAIKFTDNGSVILRATSTNTRLVIEIVDSGVGIASDEQLELFKPFVQIPQANQDIQGTGLGLAISKSLVNLMGGEISIESELGKGSTFKIELPLVLADSTELITEETQKVVMHLADNQEKVWRLLIVDDNADNRLLLMSILTSVGFDVRETKNGQEAIDAFKAWQPHLIWMDIRMPVMDGYEATSKIRQLDGGDKVKIIALTASAFVDQHQRILSSGCDAILNKPFHIADILAVLRKHLQTEFSYRDAVPPPLPLLEITKEMLMSLPLNLCHDLHEAALQLDTEETENVITQIQTISPEIAEGLRLLVNSFQFEQILSLTDDK